MAAVSSLMSSEAARFLGGSPVVWEEDSADADTPRPFPYAQQDPVGSVVAAASAVDVEEASEEEIADSEEDSTGALAADSVVVTVDSAVLPMASAAHPMHQADLVTAEVGTAADLTVTAGTMEEEVVAVAAAAVVGMADAMMTDSVVGTAALIDLAPVVMLSRLVRGRVVVTVATVVVIVATVAVIVTETMIVETIPGSALTRVVQVTKGSGNFVDTNGDKTNAGLVVGIPSPHIFAFLVFTSLPPLSTRVSRRKENLFIQRCRHPWSR